MDTLVSINIWYLEAKAIGGSYVYQTNFLENIHTGCWLLNKGSWDYYSLKTRR